MPRFTNIKSTVVASLSCLFIGGAFADPVPGQGTWESTLLGRDILLNAVPASSPEAVYLYDTALNVTWLRNAQASNEISWAAASQWAADLVTGSGAAQVTDWRLPVMAAGQSATCDFSFSGTNCGYNVGAGTSELAALFHVTLGNLSRYDALGDERMVGAGLTNTGSFLNLQASGYWLGDALDAEAAWRFDTFDGVQDVTFKDIPFFAMAVRGGDVMAAPIPEPQTFALMLTGLAVGVFVASRRRASGE